MYSVETFRYHSEYWLESNAIHLTEFNDSKDIRELISLLKYENRISLEGKFNSDVIEFHVVVEVLSGNKAYLRLLTSKDDSNKFRVLPFQTGVYRLNSPELQLKLGMR